MQPHINETVGSLCLQMHAKAKANEYAEAATTRAKAEAEYKAERAKRVLRAYLIADGMTDALTKGMIALRERIGYGRSLMANEREADKLLATNREIT